MADQAHNAPGELKERVVHINRVTKVVKGGKNFSFSALVVVGDGNGWVGYGTGKAREVPSAISKGVDQAKRNLMRVPMLGSTIPHSVVGRFGAGAVMHVQLTAKRAKTANETCVDTRPPRRAPVLKFRTVRPSILTNGEEIIALDHKA